MRRIAAVGRHAGSGSAGFTLIETLASLLVFALVTLGIVPLMLSATRASSLSRSFTVGKNIAVEAMERARGLPFYVSRGVHNQDVDFLDLYHPTPPNSGEYYELSCDSSSTALGCPRDLPDIYELTFRTRFVSVADDGTPSTVASTGYSAAAETTDAPPSRLTQFIVTADWVLGGRQRSYQIESLIGDRKFGGAETNGFGRITYAVRISTSFDTATDSNALSVTAGAAGSSIETRRESTASQSASAALLRLFDPEASDEPDLTAPVEGATLTVEAPPDYNPPAVTAADGVLSFAGLGDIAGITDTTVGSTSSFETDISVVANDDELPVAKGGFTFGGSALLDLWVDKTDVLRGPTTALRLLQGVELISAPAGPLDLRGYTSASTTALPGGAVTTGAHIEVPDLRLFPTDFAPAGVLQVTGFSADVECVGAAAGSGSADATWGATLRYWSASEGAYEDVPLLAGSAGEELADVQEANPVVLEDLTNPAEADGSAVGDIHLFPARHDHGGGIVHDHAGYLQGWASDDEVTPSVEADGRTASADIADALSLTSIALPVNLASRRATPMSVSLGTLSCQAVDFR